MSIEGLGRIIYATTMITIFVSIAVYLLIANQIISSPTSIYSVSFSGNATLKEGDLLFTFKPTVIHGLGGDALDFRLTATNLGNENSTFYHGDLEPTVEVYSAGTRVSTLTKARISDTIMYEPVVEPGKNYTIGWTWNLDSFASNPLKPGVYSVSAKWGSGKTYTSTEGVGVMIDWETPGVPMQVYFGVQPLTVTGLILTAITLTLIVLLSRRAHESPVSYLKSK